MKRIIRVTTAFFVFTILLSCSAFKVAAIALRCAENFSFLVLGVDDTWLNTDTIMLVNVDSSDETIKVLSIPRDTMVCYDGRNCKINSVFAKCISRGMSEKDSAETFKSFIDHAIGTSVSFAVILDANAFVSIVDAAHGVEITIEDDLNIEMACGEFLSLKSGVNKLLGREALYFVRHRKNYKDADLGRIGAQSAFVRGFLKKLSKLDSLSVMNVYKTALDTVVIDASPHTFSSIDSIIRSLKYRDVSFYVLPGEAVILNNVSYYKINRSEADRILSVFGGMCSPKAII